MRDASHFDRMQGPRVQVNPRIMAGAGPKTTPWFLRDV